jgi:hypothetical protein
MMMMMIQAAYISPERASARNTVYRLLVEFTHAQFERLPVYCLA